MSRHEPDCACTGCEGRDRQLEAEAERRADRQWSSDRDADMAADRYYEALERR